MYHDAQTDITFIVFAYFFQFLGFMFGLSFRLMLGLEKVFPSYTKATSFVPLVKRIPDESKFFIAALLIYQTLFINHTIIPFSFHFVIHNEIKFSRLFEIRLAGKITWIPISNIVAYYFLKNALTLIHLS